MPTGQKMFLIRLLVGLLPGMCSRMVQDVSLGAEPFSAVLTSKWKLA